MTSDFFDDLNDLPDSAESKNPESGDGIERGLSKLASLVEDINRDLSTSTILDRAMTAAIELTGAERGFLVLVSDRGEWTFRVARNMEKQEIEDAEHAASRTVLRKVLEGKESILINDVVGASDLTKQQSIAKMQVRSIMGAPLISKGKLLGAAYVDTSKLAGVFDQTSLVLFQSFVQLAAVALENARLIEAEQEATGRYREMQEYLEAVLRSQPHGVIILNEDLRVEYANPQAETLLHGYPMSPGLRFPEAAALSASNLKQIINDLTEFQGTGTSGRYTLQQGPRALSYSFFDVQRTWDGGRRVGIIVEDITGQKELERKLVESEKRFTVNQLAGGIAHEINNSLQPVKGRIELLSLRLQKAGIKTEGGIDKDIETISSLSDRIEKIARNLRHLTKPAEPDFQPLDLRHLLLNTVELMESTTGMLRGFSTDNPYAKYRLILDVPEDLPLINGDEHALESALINIVVNSSHALREKGGGILAIRALAVEEGVKVMVEDTGMGIPEDVLPRVFEPYFSTRGESGGTGLGMCIIQNVAENHGAKLELSSTYGQGTTMSILFPVLKEETEKTL